MIDVITLSASSDPAAHGLPLGEQVRIIGEDEGLLAETAESVDAAESKKRKQLRSELPRIERESRRIEDHRRTLLRTMPTSKEESKPLLDEIAAIAGRRVVLEQRLGEVRGELQAIEDGETNDDALRDALAGFTPIWEQLFPREQERILRLIIEKVTYNPDDGDVNIDLRPSAINTLAKEARETT